jgi:hypothetical protein
MVLKTSQKCFFYCKTLLQIHWWQKLSSGTPESLQWRCKQTELWEYAVCIRNMNIHILNFKKSKQESIGAKSWHFSLWFTQHTTLSSYHSTTQTRQKGLMILCPTQCPAQLNRWWLCSSCPWQILVTTMEHSREQNTNMKLRLVEMLMFKLPITFHRTYIEFCMMLTLQ